MEKQRISELKTEYKRGLEHNYLIIHGNPIQEQNYQVRMVEENEIKNFLRMERRYHDGNTDFYYEISSRQPLNRIYEQKMIRFEDLLYILDGIRTALINACEYLLDERCLVLDPKYIYMNIEKKDVWVLFYPFYQVNENAMFENLSEYFLERIDQQDAQAVMLAYRFYKVTRYGNFTIKDMEDLLEEVVSIRQEPVFAEDKTESSEGYSYFSKDKTQQENRPLQAEPEEEILFVDFSKKASEPKKEEGYNEKKGLRSWLREVLPLKEKITEETKEERDVYKENTFTELSEELYDEWDNLEEESYGKTTLLTENKKEMEHVLKYRIHGREEIFPLDKLPITIGKVKDCVDIVLKDSSVSRIHATIFMSKGELYLKDCNSTNGTFINGIRLESEEQIPLEENDQITIGKVRLEYC